MLNHDIQFQWMTSVNDPATMQIPCRPSPANKPATFNQIVLLQL